MEIARKSIKNGDYCNYWLRSKYDYSLDTMKFGLAVDWDVYIQGPSLVYTGTVNGSGIAFAFEI